MGEDLAPILGSDDGRRQRPPFLLSVDVGAALHCLFMRSPLLQPSDLQPVSTLLPPCPVLLMGAGPVPISRQVSDANRVVINHLGDAMERVVDSVKRLSAYAFQTDSARVLGVAGPSSAGMEMMVTNLCWPGRRVLCLVSGVFGARFAEMAQGIGAEVSVVEGHHGGPVTTEQLRSELRRGSYDVVTMVQGETSTGTFTTELPELCALASQHGALTIVDAVVTLTTTPFFMDDWGVDAVVTGGQKGLGCIPGISLCAVSRRGWDTIESRPGRRPHWCLDAIRAERFWGQHRYHYTAPVPGVLALREALRLVTEETLEARFERHRISTAALQAGLEAMGLTLAVAPPIRLGSVVAIEVPPGIDGRRVRSHMVQEFGVEISGGFGRELFRIGQMGEQCRPMHTMAALHALGTSLRVAGFPADVASGMASFEAMLARLHGHASVST